MQKPCLPELTHCFTTLSTGQSKVKFGNLVKHFRGSFLVDFIDKYYASDITTYQNIYIPIQSHMTPQCNMLSP